MQPSATLLAGVELLAPALEPHGFRFELRGADRGSGGDFAWGEYVRDGRRLELHFRDSLGLVTYHLAELSIGHTPYLRALGVPPEAEQYPGFSRDSMDGFRRLGHDLTTYLAEFISGDGSVLRQVAPVEMARLSAMHRVTQAGYEGDDRKREEARMRFHAGEYDRVVVLLEAIHYPALLADSERRMLELSRQRIGGNYAPERPSRSNVAPLRALKRAGLSLLLPGLGQWRQGRPIAAAFHLSTNLLAALDAQAPVTIGLAIASRLLSAYEAYRYERDSAPPLPNEEL